MFFTCSGFRTWLLTGMTTPLILIWIGAPAVKNMSEACFSDISLKSGVTNMTVPPVSIFGSFCHPDSIAAQQFVDARLGAGLCVHLLDDHGAIEAAPAVVGGKTPRHHDRAR